MDNKQTSSDLKSIVAQNIYYLRTINHMTQYELGEKLNYSDKAISKWERADGLPDVYVLKQMSELFGVSVDYMLTEHTEQDKKVDTKTNKKSTALLGNVIKIALLTISLLVFVIIAIASAGKIYYWQVFIYAIPLIAIAGIVFGAILKNRWQVLLYVSLLMWSILAAIFFGLLKYADDYKVWLIFFIGIPAQIIIFLSFKIRITVKISKKETLKQTRDEEK